MKRDVKNIKCVLLCASVNIEKISLLYAAGELCAVCIAAAHRLLIAV